MGTTYSKVMCLDATNHCTQTPLIPYPTYQQNISKMTPTQQHEYVCGQKQGFVTQCCDPFDASASHIVDNGPLLRVIRDQQGQYTDFYWCRCDTTGIVSKGQLSRV